nr:MAG TPA: hypothetical protein [Caudoviricetes sp.]
MYYLIKFKRISENLHLRQFLKIQDFLEFAFFCSFLKGNSNVLITSVNSI